jgi:hypothetical protein
MTKENKTIEIFKAKDGKEFLTEKECLNYENNTLKKLENIKYFKYCTGRDLTETGMFYRHNYAAVYIAGYGNCYYEVLLQYLLGKNKGLVLSPDVQGYSVTSSFSIHEINKKQYFDKIPNKWGGSVVEPEQILLSEEPINGFPENIKVISKHINYK